MNNNDNTFKFALNGAPSILRPFQFPTIFLKKEPPKKKKKKGKPQISRDNSHVASNRSRTYAKHDSKTKERLGTLH